MKIFGFFLALFVWGLVVVLQLKKWLQVKSFIITRGTLLTNYSMIGSDGDGQLQHNVNLRYCYDVNGEKYESERISPWESSSLGSDARLKVSQYKTGQQVNVYYDPQNPEWAFLDIGFPRQAIIMIVILVIPVIGLGLTLIK